MKTIYVNGDSYTAGEELADYSLPGFPGTTKLNVSESFTQINNKWMKDRLQLIPDYHSHSKASKKLAWPGQLEHKNLRVINGSKSGASMSGIAMRTMYDLLALKEKNIVPDIVLIQLTSFDRIEIFSERDPDYGFFDSPVAHCFSDNNNVKKLHREYIATYSDSDFIIKFLYGLINLQCAVKAITGKAPILLSTPLSSHFTKIVTNSNRKDLLQMSMIDNTDPLNLPMEHFQELAGNNLMPGHHSDLQTHILFAEEVYEKYIKNL